MLSDKTREALKAKAYITEILAGMIPSDPEFNEIWALIPDHIAERIETVHVSLANEFITLAEQIREIRQKHHNARLDRFQG